ncbi:MAG: 4-aminobutyrate--2-oxoglutarate transaminase [Proteobacteria bacterium]|nr:4-aminobutyrate--2-oxoglutarate transaminase [Pseudomonadota bacterium]
MDGNSRWQERKERATARGTRVLTKIYAQRAENAELWDVEGRRYIDFVGGIGTLNTGHRHPKVMATVEAQMKKFTHVCHQIFPDPGYVELAEKLNGLTPGKFAKKTAFFSTGAEAVENAVKIARVATGRSAVIAFSGAFHGRGMMGLALTGKVAPYKTGFGPLPAEVYHIPFPIALRGVSVDDSLRALDDLLRVDVDAQRVAAIIIEPVQGEGGFHVAPPDLMRGLREVCDTHGIVLIADEVQTGFGRTGKLFAMEHYAVVPDLVVMAKSLAGGFPLSAVTGRAELMDAAAEGGLGGTYGGNPLAVVAALAVLDIIAEEKLLERADQLGARLKNLLNRLKPAVPEIAEVRGLGAMIAIEFKQPDSGEPNPAFARRVQADALQSGLVLLTCGTHSNAIRFLMPLTIQDGVFSEALLKLERAVVGG